MDQKGHIPAGIIAALFAMSSQVAFVASDMAIPSGFLWAKAPPGRHASGCRFRHCIRWCFPQARTCLLKALMPEPRSIRYQSRYPYRTDIHRPAVQDSAASGLWGHCYWHQSDCRPGAECHSGIVRPLSGTQFKRSASHHAFNDWLSGPGPETPAWSLSSVAHGW